MPPSATIGTNQSSAPKSPDAYAAAHGKYARPPKETNVAQWPSPRKTLANDVAALCIDGASLSTPLSQTPRK